MGRPRLDRNELLKKFVLELKHKCPDSKTFTHADVAAVGKSNQIGFTAFTSKKMGFGKLTRLSHGVYHIPDTWKANAPWATETTASAAKEKKVKKVVPKVTTPVVKETSSKKTKKEKVAKKVVKKTEESETIPMPDLPKPPAPPAPPEVDEYPYDELFESADEEEENTETES